MNNLNDFEIIRNGKNNYIRFNNDSLRNLEDLLNTNLNTDKNIQSYLDELIEINKNWNNLNRIIQNKYSGFWDWETLQNYDIQGRWFSFAGYEDFNIYISVDERKIYIDNDLIPDYPTLILNIDEFIQILMQWKDLL